MAGGAGGFMGMNFTTDPGAGGGSSNQYFANMPSLPQAPPPGVVPAAPNANTGLLPGSKITGQSGSTVDPFTRDIGGGARSISPLDPNLTGSLFNFLTGQIGQGASPFNLSALLPSSGDVTAPGTLSAPTNPLLQMLQQFFTSGGTQGGTPGLDTLEQFSKGIDTLPSYNAITGAMDRNIAEGAANLKESMNVGGNLVGSPYGTASADYNTQAEKDKSSILAQLYQNTLGLQEGAATTLAGEGGNLASALENMDQASIDRLLQEFIRTRPEYSPLLNAQFGAATTFPPIFQQNKGQSPLGALIPSLASAGGAGAAAGLGGGSLTDILTAAAGAL